MILLYIFLKYEEEREKVAIEMEDAAVHQVIIKGGLKGDLCENPEFKMEQSKVPIEAVEGSQRRSKRRVASRIDYLGLMLIMTSIILCIVSSSLAADHSLDWNSPTVISLFTIGGICFILFIVVEMKISSEPSVPINILVQNPLSILILLGKFFEFFILVGVVSHLPHWYAIVMGDSPSSSGARLIPIMFAFIISSALSGASLTILKKAWPFPMLGMGITCISVGLLTTIHMNTPYALIAFYLFIMGLGLGATHQALTVLLIEPIDRTLHASMLSTQQFMQNSGSVIGVQCFQVALRFMMNVHMDDEDAGDINRMTRDRVTDMSEVDRNNLFQEYTNGIRVLFWILVPISLVSFVMMIPMYKVKTSDIEQDQKQNIERTQTSSLPTSQ